MGSSPYLGKFGAIGLAPQTAVGTPATIPTLWLNTTGFMPPTPTLNYSTDATADGSLDASDDRLQGVTLDARQFSFNPSMADLPLLLTWMLGTAATGATAITRRSDNWAPLAPGVPVTIWQLHPTGHTIIQDAQLSQLQLTVGTRATTVAQLSVMGSPRPFTIPGPQASSFVPNPASADIIQFLHWWVSYAGNTLRPSTGTITIGQPMEVEDGARGLDPTNALYAIGVERGGGIEFMLDFTTGQADNAYLASLFNAYSGGVNAQAKTGFKIGTKEIEFTVGKGKVKTAQPGTDLGRIQVQYQIRAQRNLPGNNFEVSKIPAAS